MRSLINIKKERKNNFGEKTYRGDLIKVYKKIITQM